MTTAPPPPPTEARARRIFRIPVSRDLTYRGIEYRLAEPFRSDGASIRSADGHLQCPACQRRITPGMRIFYDPRARNRDRVVRCIPCAIRGHALIAVGGPA
jgi:hypothetical protein